MQKVKMKTGCQWRRLAVCLHNLAGVQAQIGKRPPDVLNGWNPDGALPAFSVSKPGAERPDTSPELLGLRANLASGRTGNLLFKPSGEIGQIHFQNPAYASKFQHIEQSLPGFILAYE